jgi:hypothetical protein
MKLSALSALLAASTMTQGALACELALVAPATSVLKKPVEAGITVVDGSLVAKFSVTTPRLNAKTTLGPGQFPYMFDVVEVFVTLSDTGFPYYEFEVSPHNQTLQVRIESRARHQEGVDLGLVSTAAITPSGWTAEMKIPLRPLGLQDDVTRIRGNLYAVLGKAPRSYWSAWLPRARKPDFHQPGFFQPLLKCS